MHIRTDSLLRVSQVLQRIPVARSTWWKMVKEGRAPQPIKLGPRTTAWRARDIDALANGEWQENAGGDV